MIEKVNPSHPDKVADRIAGAIVDLAYKKQENPKIAVEVLIGHGYGHVVIETSAPLEKEDVAFIVDRMAPGIRVGTTSRKSTSQTEISLLIQLLFT